MHIRFSPMRRDDRLEASVSGDVLTINGEAFDFSAIAEGTSLPREAVTCDWLASDVERIDGQIRLALILPHGANAPGETLFPVPVVAIEGTILLPFYDL